MVVVGVGSTEQHGPHLPAMTDPESQTGEKSTLTGWQISSLKKFQESNDSANQNQRACRCLGYLVLHDGL